VLNTPLFALHLEAKVGAKPTSSWWRQCSLGWHRLLSSRQQHSFPGLHRLLHDVRRAHFACIPANTACAGVDMTETSCCLHAAVQGTYDVSYVCFNCVIGTVTNVLDLTASDGTPWIKFSVRVPTPNSESFTL
jgi:hypothetical protein